MRRAALCCVVLAACGCVGPNFHPPTPPKVERFTADALPDETASSETAGGGAQRFLLEQEVPHDWWTRFGSERRWRCCAANWN